LRNAEIAKRKRILDLGSGCGIVLPELKRRSGGTVIALDRSMQALSAAVCHAPSVCGDAAALPFAGKSFDLVFSQNVLLWCSSVDRVIHEVSRTLMPGGVWVLFEPDYGGMMEYPTELETAALWKNALQRAGADPFIGRKLAPLLSAANFQLRVELLPQLALPHPARFEFLSELPLTTQEQERLQQIRRASEKLVASQQVAHLPYFLVIAEPS
jgi:ubiquinone/menaquinone biosynthesis C-methylase UbiE